MAKVLVGQQLVFRNRPDAAFFADQEQQAFSSVQELMPRWEQVIGTQNTTGDS